ncbi:MAG: formimidoylglutamate deiminase [Polyangiaceae bacterium]|nr:formimidoylglutamate deiminase [Polyangiaceae bacterium]
MKVFELSQLWRPEGWLAPAFVSVGADGVVLGVTSQAPAEVSERFAGVALAGIPNLHSHAFQRAMAGLTERGSSSEDSFWSWREVMYRFVDRLEPEHIEAIAAWLYVEMLEAGYTSVAEFHYLHHDPRGAVYADPAQMSRRILAAAEHAGIGLTLLPVLYARSGFDAPATLPSQRRFASDVDFVLGLFESLHSSQPKSGQVRFGVAPHSLRAVSLPQFAALVDGARAIAPDVPVHVHIAEQLREVEDSLASSGQRPVERLLAHVDVDAHFCLVHATHVTAPELDGIVTRGATVALCPTTEANLGDGPAPVLELLARSGAFGIGSDSHVCVCPAQELRSLEYVQRLLLRRRNVSCSAEEPSVARTLISRALAAGAPALGRPVGALTPGSRADFIVLDPNHPALMERARDDVLDAWVFVAGSAAVRDVVVGGHAVVRGGRHVRRDELLSRYRAALRQVL